VRPTVDENNLQEADQDFACIGDLQNMQKELHMTINKIEYHEKIVIP
jgi:hypothetical protein